MCVLGTAVQGVGTCWWLVLAHSAVLQLIKCKTSACKTSGHTPMMGSDCLHIESPRLYRETSSSRW